MGLIAGAAGGWLASILNLAGTGFGVTIVPGTLLYLNGQVLKYVIMVLVTLALGFALTWIFGYKEEEVELKKKLLLKILHLQNQLQLHCKLKQSLHHLKVKL